MPPMPKRCVMRIPFIEYRQGKVFEIAMIWRCEDQIAAILQTVARIYWQEVRREEMLDHFGGYNSFELFLMRQQLRRVVLDTEVIERDGRIGCLGDRNAAFVIFDARNLITGRGKLGAEGAVSGTEVKNP